MPLFYRVENKTTKRGPYGFGTESRAIIDEWLNSKIAGNRHPNPDHDTKLVEEMTKDYPPSKYEVQFKLYDWHDFKFGFSSIEQFRAWFYDDSVLLRMDKSNMVLSVYEAPKVFIGNTQSVVESAYCSGSFLKEMLPLVQKVVDAK